MDSIENTSTRTVLVEKKPFDVEIINSCSTDWWYFDYIGKILTVRKCMGGDLESLTNSNATTCSEIYIVAYNPTYKLSDYCSGNAILKKDCKRI